MPVMFQSIKASTGQARIDKYRLASPMPQRGYTKFHGDLTVPPIPAGQLGTEWLAMARKRLGMLHEREIHNIRQAARWAVDARASGGTAYFWGTGHVLGHIRGSEHNPTIFTAFPAVPNMDAPMEGTALPGFTANDFALGIGYDAVVANDPHKLAWLRRAGAKIALSAARYKPENNKTEPGEIFIDQRWEFGDADVTVPGYDVNIAPTSGLLAIEVYLMICAEINALEAATNHQPPAAR